MGLYLAKPEVAKNTQTEEHDSFTFSCTQVQGWKIRQEEVVISRLNFEGHNSLFMLLERAGGNEMADFVVAHFTQVLANDADYKRGLFDKALRNTYEVLDQKLLQFKDSCSYQGLTLLAVLVTEEIVYVANCGLSRCIVRSESKHKVMSVDHYPINDIEKQRILAAGGEVWENRLNAHLPFTRCLGFFEYKQNPNLEPGKQQMLATPSVKWVEKSETKFVLFGSQGFWQAFTNGGIAEVVMERLHQNKSGSEILEAIVDSLVPLNFEQEKDKVKDNISCGVIVFK